MNQNFLQCVRTAALAILLSATSAAGLAAQESGTILRGDVNGDGQISALDALAILAHTVGKTLPDGFTILPNGDNNGDGQITAMDALLGLSHTVGKDVSEYPIGEPLAPPTPVASITVEAGTGQVLARGTLQLSAIARDSSNAAIPDAAIRWTTSDSARATVSASGLVTGVYEGDVVITASSDSVSGQAVVTVLPGGAASTLEVTPRSTTLLLDSTIALSAKVLDAAGNPVPGRTLTWRSLEPETAVVSDSGVVTGLALGTAEIEVTDSVMTATATVTVVAAASKANRTWVGGAAAGATDWGVAENWDPVGVPTDTDTLSIPAAPTHRPELMQSLETIAGLVMEPGAELDIGANELQVTGRLDVDGSVFGTGTLSVRGVKGRESYVRGLFPNLTITGTTVIIGPTQVEGSLGLNSNSVLDLNGHSVDVRDNLTIEGALQMRSPADTLDVGGDARFFNDSQSTEAVLSAGTLLVGGDFTVEVSIGSAANPFPAGGTHRLVLDGSEKQTVRNDGLETVTIQELDLENTAGGVVFTAAPTGRFNVQGRFDALTPVAISGDGRVNALRHFTTLTGGSVELINLAVRGVLVAGSDFRPDTLTLIGEDQLIPAGSAYQYQNLVVAGSAAFTGTTGIAGGLTIGCITPLSECLYRAGQLNLAGRTVTVGGDLRQTQMQPDAPLYMNDAQGALTIRGSVLGPVGLESGAIEFSVGAGQWDAGTLRVGGDLFARGAGATGGHQTILDGAEVQELRVITGFHFMHLAVRDSAGVVLNDTTPEFGRRRVAGVRGDFNVYTAVPVSGTGRLDVAGNVQIATGSTVELSAISVGATLQPAGTFRPDTAEFTNSGSSQSIPYASTYNNVVVRGTAAFGGSMTFNGSLIVLSGAELDVEDRHVTVTENLKVSGILRMQSAADTLTVLGDTAVFTGRYDPQVKAYATRGVLRVAGNLLSDSTGFYPTRDHKVVVSGGDRTVVTGAFQDLEIAGTGSGVAPGMRLLNVTVAGSLVARSGTGKLQFEETIAVAGDADLTQTDTVSAYGQLAIGGNLRMRNLRIGGAAGSATVGGGLTLVDSAYLDGLVTYSGDYVEEGVVLNPDRGYPALTGLYGIRWVQQPASTVAGAAFDPVVSVELLASGSTRLMTGSAVVWLEGNGTTLAGEARATTVDGVATFPGLAPETVGVNRLLRVFVTLPGGHRTAVYSTAFEVVAP